MSSSIRTIFVDGLAVQRLTPEAEREAILSHCGWIGEHSDLADYRITYRDDLDTGKSSYQIDRHDGHGGDGAGEWYPVA